MGIIFIVIGLLPIAIGAILYAATNEIAVLLVTSAMGAVFIVIGIVLVVIKSQKKKRKERIINEGICIDTEVYEIKINYAVKIDNHNPYTIYSKYVDEETGKEYNFVSEYISIKRKQKGLISVGTTPKVEVGDIVKVYVMKDNFDEYIFELNA